jgi:nucleotide-binding universal stress UspA family protein
MPLTDILVATDDHRRAAPLFRVAAGYAYRHGARLTGVLYTGQPLFAPPRNHEEEAMRTFSLIAAERGVESRWINGGRQGVGPDVLFHHARSTGLVIAGQPPGEGHKGGHPDLPERLILNAGRPVLIVPYAGTFSTYGERVIVAWNDGRESARALHDALPILRLAQRVTLLGMVDSDEDDTAPDRFDAVASYLGRCGIDPRPEELFAPDFPLADLLLNRVAEEGADLLVMGAFGQPPGNRPVLGRIARHFLKHMTLPVLMAH